MFCPRCGSEAHANATFCASCGTQLRAPAEPSDGNEPTVVDAAPATATPAPERTEPPPSRGMPDRALWALLIVGIVVAGAGIGLALTGGSSDGSSEGIDTPELGSGVPAEPEPVAGTPGPTESTTPVVSDDGATLTCTNEILGYQLNYPSDWFTDAAGPRQECRFFSMEPFEIARGEAPTTDIAVFDVDEPFDEWVEAYNDPDQVTINGETELTVAGQRAVLLDLTFKEVVTDAHVYIVDAMGKTLQFYAVLEHTTDFEGSKRVLDAMVQSMVFQ